MGNGLAGSLIGENKGRLHLKGRAEAGLSSAAWPLIVSVPEQYRSGCCCCSGWQAEC